MKKALLFPGRQFSSYVLLSCLLVGSPAWSSTSGRATAPAAKDFPQTGIASYYADKHNGKPTASGEIFDMHALTAAHRTLPFGTKLKVTCPATGRSVIVRVNDRGPFVKGRIIDLSRAAAEQLQLLERGIGEVNLEIVR